MSADLLEGIDLVVFDKDGTLIDFQRMWGDWVHGLADDLRRTTRLPMLEPLQHLLGVDPTTGLVQPHGLLAATPMVRIRAVVVDAVERAGTSRSAAERAVQAAWQPPDPVALARPLTDLPMLFGELKRRIAHLAVATSDDRDPTERTLAALRVDRYVSAIVCADDGLRVKPAPDAVIHLCAETRVPPERTAVVGDAPADVAMGRAAGVRRVIGVLTGAGDAATLGRDADMVLGSVVELLAG